MQGEAAQPPSPPVDEPEAVATRLRRQVSRVRRWVEWELWLREPRSFSPPDESQSED